MSAGGGGGGGGRRKLNAELNLTSYIDLMSTLIIFLLMTAVWNNIDALSTNSANSTTSDAADQQQPPPVKKVSLSISVFDNRVELAEDQKTKTIDHVNGEINTAQVIDQLGKWKETYPDREDVILNTDNKIPYRQLIQVFDLLVGNKWPDVGVNTM